MMLEINLLDPFMEDKIMRKCQGGLAVHLMLDRIRLVPMEIAEQSS
jgi:hypothetical protein